MSSLSGRAGCGDDHQQRSADDRPAGLLTRCTDLSEHQRCPDHSRLGLSELRMIRYQATAGAVERCCPAGCRSPGLGGDGDRSPRRMRSEPSSPPKLFGFQDDVSFVSMPPDPAAARCTSTPRPGSARATWAPTPRHVMNLTEAVYQLAPPSSRIRAEEEWSLDEEPGPMRRPKPGRRLEQSWGRNRTTRQAIMPYQMPQRLEHKNPHSSTAEREPYDDISDAGRRWARKTRTVLQ